jgi:putative tryptophan/tyrosine transport system substrate-binding protein
MSDMKRRKFITLLGGAGAVWPLAARAQQAARVYRIGYLSPASHSPEMPEMFALTSEALRGLGWIQGKNVVVERRYANNILDRLPDLATELVRLHVDVIIATGTLAPLAAKQATSTIPIVMTAAGDPLGTGLIASLARPGGNVTGLSLMAPDLGGKRLELLKEIFPGLSQAGVVWNAANPYSAVLFKQTETAAQTIGIRLHSIEVRAPDDFNRAFEAAKPDLGALIIVEDPLTVNYRKRIADFAAANGLPAIYGLREFVGAGGLMSYGASLPDLYRRAARYVDRILKGAKPADLPVEQPTKFDLVINLKIAKALGLEVPPTLLARADEVIE